MPRLSGYFPTAVALASVQRSKGQAQNASPGRACSFKYARNSSCSSKNNRVGAPWSRDSADVPRLESFALGLRRSLQVSPATLSFRRRAPTHPLRKRSPRAFSFLTSKSSRMIHYPRNSCCNQNARKPGRPRGL